MEITLNLWKCCFFSCNRLSRRNETQPNLRAIIQMVAFSFIGRACARVLFVHIFMCGVDDLHSSTNRSAVARYVPLTEERPGTTRFAGNLEIWFSFLLRLQNHEWLR